MRRIEKSLRTTGLIDEQDFKQKNLELSNPPSIASHFQPQSETVAVNKDEFIWGIIQLIMSAVSAFLKVRDFKL